MLNNRALWPRDFCPLVLYNLVAMGTVTPSWQSDLSATSAADRSAGVFSLAASDADLQSLARRLRRHVVTMIGKAGSGHPGGSLSAVEIVTALYFKVMRHKPAVPAWSDRDRFILSKGHAAPLLYATLAECGYLPVEQLLTLRQMNSCLQGHPDCSLIPGIEMSAGALGQGLSYAVGVSLARRLNNQDYNVYVLLGDGECDEGQIWEAAMSAAHFKLDRLVAIVDRNGIQLSGWDRDIMNLEPLDRKWLAFGWNVIEVDGHSIPELTDAFHRARQVTGQPSVVIARTVKGKGVSFMENNPDFHGKAPSPDEMKKALEELA